MDKTLELIIAATVILLTALTVIFMVGGQAGDFGSWADGAQKDASCNLEKTKYENACNCDAQGGSQETTEAQNIKSKSSCSWTGSTSCQSVCEGGSSSSGENTGDSSDDTSDGDGGGGGSIIETPGNLEE